MPAARRIEISLQTLRLIRSLRLVHALCGLVLIALLTAPASWPQGSSATFLHFDTSSLGSWEGIYGADGYLIPNGTQEPSTYATVAVQNGFPYTWNASPVDPRAIETGNGSSRIASTWYNNPSFDFDVNFTDGNPHQFAVYALDWDSRGRAETIEVRDAATNGLLDSEAISNFSNGVYLLWNITGHVKINVILSAGPNAVISGVFFGGGGSSSPPSPALSITKSHVGSFTQGQQNATYTVTVTNAPNAAPTTGAVTVTETIPSGLALVSMAGTGWTCPANTNTCTQSNALNAGTSYLPITVTVNVLANASSPQVNQVSVSGGGSAGANTSDSTLITANSNTGNAAQFIQADTATSGNWQASYGAQGYSIPNSLASTPSGVSFTPQNEAPYSWAPSTSDSRALSVPGGSQRIASTWYNSPLFDFDVNFTDGNPHQFAVYALDWDSRGRAETIEVRDAATNGLLDSEAISNFSNGVYLLWNITGHVKINVILSAGPNAVISGVFFGGGGSSSPPSPALSITKSHVGSFTQGQQNATYTVTVTNAPNAAPTTGAVTVTETIPSGLALVSMAGTGWTCPANTNTCTQSNALNAGTSYLPITVTVNVLANASSPQVNQVSVSGGGSAGANTSDSTLITANSNTGNAAQFIQADTATSGNWQASYGAQGYSIPNSLASTPSGVSFTPQNEAPYSWAPSTSDSRALSVPGGSQRIASTWYNSPLFDFDVNFTDGNPHQFAVYALDWDSRGRAETIEVRDAATNGLLDSEAISNFSNGVYLVWTITGHVKINVILSAGPNAVISGVFFGGVKAAATLASLAITPVNPSIPLGTSQQFTAVGTYNDGSTANLTSTAIWNSSSTSTATISASGVATGLLQGPTTITASLGGITSNQSTLTIAAPALSSITVTPSNPTIAVGSMQQFTATGNHTDGSKLDLTATATWNSSAPGVATVSTSGSATAVGPGPATITATLGNISGNTALTVAAPITVSPQAVSLNANQVQQFTATVVGITGQSVAWSLNPNVGILTVSGNTATYTAPSPITVTQTITLIAISTVDATKFGTASITLTSGATANFVRPDDTTQGNWKSAYGSDGYYVLGDSQSIPSYATFTPQNQSSTIWAATTTDVRALQTGNGQGRIAATWFNFTTFSFDLNFTDHIPHLFALYAVDWDNKSRAETVQILDATTNNILDTRSISDCENGIYLVWNISGHVTINIINTNGPNAVISGAFFNINSAAPPPAPVLISVNPTAIGLGAFTIAVTGSNFANGAQIVFDGNTLPTTSVLPTDIDAGIATTNQTELIATGNATADELGAASVSVQNPGAGGGVSNSLSVTVTNNQQVSANAAVRFLEQSAFGPTAAQVSQLQQIGFTQYLVDQFNAPISPYASQDYTNDFTVTQKQIFTHALTGMDQLRQRVAVALSEIWVTSVNTIGPYGMAPYMQLLTQDAFTNYRNIMQDVTLSPTMGDYLNMVDNDAAAPGSNLHANENYARELLQLFTIGLYMLNPDGSLQLDSNGNPMPSYDESIVQAFARVFTGWTYPTESGATLQTHNPANWHGSMVAVGSNHDMTAKTVLLGTTLSAGQTAAQDLSAALDNIFNHPNIGPFVAQQLIQHLVTSNPSPQYVARVANAFATGSYLGFGSGTRGDMQAVIAAILLDPEARRGDDLTTAVAIDGHLREPIVFVADLLRTFGAVSDGVGPVNLVANMGQPVFQSPSVFNFFPPDYVIPGTTLLGPEFGIQTTATSLVRINFVNSFAYGSIDSGTAVNFTPYATLASTDVNQLIDSLNTLLLHGTLSSAARTAVLAAVNSVPTGPNQSLLQAQAAIYAIASSSQYQVQH